MNVRGFEEGIFAEITVPERGAVISVLGDGFDFRVALRRYGGPTLPYLPAEGTRGLLPVEGADKKRPWSGQKTSVERSVCAPLD